MIKMYGKLNPTYGTMLISQDVFPEEHSPDHFLQSILNISLVRLSLLKSDIIPSYERADELKESLGDLADCTELVSDFVAYIDTLPSSDTPDLTKREIKILQPLQQLTETIRITQEENDVSRILFTPTSYKLIAQPDAVRHHDCVAMPGDSGGVIFDPTSHTAISIVRNGRLSKEENIVQSFEYNESVLQTFTSLKSQLVLEWIYNNLTPS